MDDRLLKIRRFAVDEYPDKTESEQKQLEQRYINEQYLKNTIQQLQRDQRRVTYFTVILSVLAVGAGFALHWLMDPEGIYTTSLLNLLIATPIVMGVIILSKRMQQNNKKEFILKLLYKSQQNKE